MNKRVGNLSKFAVAVWILVICSPPANAKANYVQTTNFIVSYESLAKEDVNGLVADAEKALLAIISYIGRQDTKPIRIKIGNDYLFPRFDQEQREIFIPASRIVTPSDTPIASPRRGTALISLIVPVVVQSRNGQWGGLLETGLRVFLQEKLGKNDERPFPTMGRDLHLETAALAAEYGRLIPIDEVEKARTWRTKMTRTRRLAYLEAGSFVRFLIERHGLEKFMTWYDGARFETVYGRSLPDHEQEWAAHIRAAQP